MPVTAIRSLSSSRQLNPLILLRILKSRNSIAGIDRPTPSLVEDAKRKWGESEKFIAQEHSLRRLYQELFPKHDNLAEVLTKVTVLDSYYSTNVYFRFELAKRIVELNPDDRIATGDATLINEMAAVPVAEKLHRYYSFASKYCSQHNPDVFPIYDDLVSKMLCYLGSVDGFAKFRAKDLKDYPCFVEIIRAFKKFYGLEQFSLRWVDRYLWFAGRKAFGRKKKGREAST